jgi:hypothetical protein
MGEGDAAAGWFIAQSWPIWRVSGRRGANLAEPTPTKLPTNGAVAAH